MSRRQVKRIVRLEAVITSLIGALLGLVLGRHVRAGHQPAAGGRRLPAHVPDRDAAGARRGAPRSRACSRRCGRRAARLDWTYCGRSHTSEVTFAVHGQRAIDSTDRSARRSRCGWSPSRAEPRRAAERGHRQRARGPRHPLGQGGSSPQFPLTGAQISAAADTGRNVHAARGPGRAGRRSRCAACRSPGCCAGRLQPAAPSVRAGRRRGRQRDHAERAGDQQPAVSRGPRADLRRAAASRASCGRCADPATRRTSCAAPASRSR